MLSIKHYRKPFHLGANDINRNTDTCFKDWKSLLFDGCVSQIVLLGGRIKDFGTVSVDDRNGFAEIIASQEPSALPAIALHHTAKRQYGLAACHPPPHARAFETT